MATRDGSQYVEVYNSGLVIFVYDEAIADAIKQSKVSLLSRYRGEMELEDKALQKLAASGKLAAYELYQDDSRQIEVIVGPPLTAKEKKVARWHKVQETLLSAPSGRVWIESYDTLRLGEDEPTDPGALVTVPPGDYVFSLHRIDWDALEEAGIAWEGPFEVIVLTPVAEAKAPKRPPAMLMWPVPKPVWGQWTIADGVFQGKVVGGAFIMEGPITNLDRKAAAELGLARYQRLEITIEGKTHQAIYLGGLCFIKFNFGKPPDNDYRRFYDLQELQGMLADETAVLQAGWMAGDQAGYQVLAFRELKGDAPLSKDMKSGLPVTVRVLTEPFGPAPDVSWAESWRAEAGVLTGEIVASTEFCLALGLGEDALAAIGVAGQGEMTLAAGGQTRRVVYCPSKEEVAAAQKEFTVLAASRARILELREEMQAVGAKRRELPFSPTEDLPTNAEHASLMERETGLYKEAQALSKPALTEEISANMPLAGYLASHWDLPDRKVLVCEPLFASDEARVGFTVPVGTAVTVRSLASKS